MLLVHQPDFAFSHVRLLRLLRLLISFIACLRMPSHAFAWSVHVRSFNVQWVYPLGIRSAILTFLLVRPHRAAVHKHLDIRKVIPDPHPHKDLDNPWCEAIAVVRCRYNRMVVYDGRRLHNQFLEPAAYKRLSLNPRRGRLTINSFFWRNARTMDARGILQDVPYRHRATNQTL